MTQSDGSTSFYFFDLDDNLFFLPTQLYLWNSETKKERALSTGVFATVQHLIGKSAEWQEWSVTERTYRDFGDVAGIPAEDQQFSKDLFTAVNGSSTWQGPSWPLLVHASKNQRPVAFISARAHSRDTIEAGFNALASEGILPAPLRILGIYTVTNADVRNELGAHDPNTSIPSLKKLAIMAAVEKGLAVYGSEPPHRFGISDDDPNNVILAITAMRDCKVKYSDKRFFVVNTNHEHYVKLEVFPMMHPVTADREGMPLLSSADERPHNERLNKDAMEK